jgi:hypothetical protein
MGMGVKFLRYVNGSSDELQEQFDIWRALNDAKNPEHLQLVNQTRRDAGTAEKSPQLERFSKCLS